MRTEEQQFICGLKGSVTTARKARIGERPVATTIRGRGADERLALAKACRIREDPIDFDRHTEEGASKARVGGAEDDVGGRVNRRDDRVWRRNHFGLTRL